MTPSPAIVHLVDDEPGMRRALSRLLQSEGFHVIAHASAHAFLKACQPQELACAVLDVAMPEFDGLELQQHLANSGVDVPIVFLTGHGDIPMSVRAMKLGAVDFLTKPVQDTDLFRAVRAAVAAAKARHSAATESAALARRLATLTQREVEVLRHVIAGRLNKQIAAEIGTGEQNVKIHRSRVMKKLGVCSVADLVRASQRLGLTPA